MRKRIGWLLVALMLALAITGHAQNARYHQAAVTVTSGAAVKLRLQAGWPTDTQINSAAVCNVGGGNALFWMDGNDPTTSSGLLLASNSCMTISPGSILVNFNLYNLSFIATTATNASIATQFFRP